MKRVAITGGIGSGKSTVCRMLAEVGDVEVYDSDTRAKEIMNSHPEVVAAVKALFGPEAYADGALNRAHVAAAAFGNEDLLGRLNAIVHPVVVADFEAWAESRVGEYVVLESALLFTSPLVGHYDLAVVVDAPDEVRVARCVARDGSTAEQVRGRMARQMSRSEMRQRADVVICNDGTEPLLPQVEKVDAIIRKQTK